jgi:hypothetical protein
MMEAAVFTVFFLHACLIFVLMSKPLPSRNELLAALINIPGVSTDGTLLDDAQKKFHEILNSSNSPTLVEWLFTQLIGPPRTVVQQFISQPEVVIAVGRVAGRMLPPEQSAAFMAAVELEIKGTEREEAS